MPIQSDDFSRLRFTEPVVINGVETFGSFDRPSFLDRKQLSDEEILEFEVRPPFAKHPDLIAFELYGSERLDWVIVMFNNPENTLNWPPNGAIIQYPSPDLVLPEVQ